METILSRSKQRKISPRDSNSEEDRYSILQILFTKNEFNLKQKKRVTFVVGLDEFLNDISIFIGDEEDLLKFASENQVVENVCEGRSVRNRQKTFRAFKCYRIERVVEIVTDHNGSEDFFELVILFISLFWRHPLKKIFLKDN